MDYMSSYDEDMSWLTQVPSQKKVNQNESSSDSEIDVIGLVPSLEHNKNVCDEKRGYGWDIKQFLSQSVTSNRRILYDNVEIEEISSDKELEQM